MQTIKNKEKLQGIWSCSLISFGINKITEFLELELLKIKFQKF